MDDHAASTLGLLELIRQQLVRMTTVLERQASRGANTYKVASPAGGGAAELLPRRDWRHSAVVYNDSTAILYVKLGSYASADDYTAQLASGAYYTAPIGYSGNITGAWATVNGQARVTELY